MRAGYRTVRAGYRTVQAPRRERPTSVFRACTGHGRQHATAWTDDHTATTERRRPQAYPCAVRQHEAGATPSANDTKSRNTEECATRDSWLRQHLCPLGLEHLGAISATPTPWGQAACVPRVQSTWGPFRQPRPRGATLCCCSAVLQRCCAACQSLAVPTANRMEDPRDIGSHAERTLPA